jgi:adenylate cyclase
MLELVYEVGGKVQRTALSGSEVTLGRSSDNGIVLNDFSVSRRHAAFTREAGKWWVSDQHSTNGLTVNGAYVERASLRPGDVLSIGVFTLTVHEEVERKGPRGASVGDPSATFVRSLADFNRDFGLDAPAAAVSDLSSTLLGRRIPPAERREKLFEILVQVAKTLIVARDVNEILEKVVELLFGLLPAERAAVVLLDEKGRPVPMLARRKGKKGGEGTDSFSHTIVETVVRQRVAVLTSDALSDGRFDAGESIRIQQIRSAMCVPLWNREKVIGALHVDSSLKTGSFSAEDLDLLTALGNFAAVAIERARLQGQIEREERIRERLSRYHSPAVVEEIASESSALEKVRARPVTVLFADIVGFTSVAETMEPEAVSAFLSRVFTFAADAVFGQGGTLDKFIGDAVMAFFGAPIAQADHPRRAVAAAARLLEAVLAWNVERSAAGDPPVALRIGINTGNAVVGDIGSDQRVDYTVLGNTVNVAARLEEYVAGPNEIVVGEETARLTGDDYSFVPLGEVKLKGLSKGLKAFRVALDAKGIPVRPVRK